MINLVISHFDLSKFDIALQDAEKVFLPNVEHITNKKVIVNFYIFV